MLRGGLEDAPTSDIAGDAREILQQPGAMAGDISGPQAGAGMAVDALHRAGDDIGGDLEPEVPRGAAVAGKDAGDGEATLGEDLDVMTEAEDDPFQRRPPDMGQAVMQAEADQGAAGMGVLQRQRRA